MAILSSVTILRRVCTAGSRHCSTALSRPAPDAHGYQQVSGLHTVQGRFHPAPAHPAGRGQDSPVSGSAERGAGDSPSVRRSERPFYLPAEEYEKPIICSAGCMFLRRPFSIIEAATAISTAGLSPEQTACLHRAHPRITRMPVASATTFPATMPIRTVRQFCTDQVLEDAHCLNAVCHLFHFLIGMRNDARV